MSIAIHVILAPSPLQTLRCPKSLAYQVLDFSLRAAVHGFDALSAAVRILPPGRNSVHGHRLALAEHPAFVALGCRAYECLALLIGHGASDIQVVRLRT